MRCLLVIYTLVTIWNSMFSLYAKELPQTYRALTQEDRWLNVSRSLTAEDLKGRIILVDFWTFCCINCMHVIPDLHYLEKKFGNKLTVVGVHSAKFANEKEQENIRAAVLRYEIEHPVVNDSDFRIWHSFGTRAWPTLALINPDGRIAEIYSGEGHREALEEDIGDLIKKYKGKLVESPLPLALEKNKEPEQLLSFPGKLAEARWQGKPALVISDTNHHRVLVARPEGEILFTIGSGKAGLKDGTFAEAQFNQPQGVVTHGNLIYVADTSNHALRRIDLENKRVQTLAGTGQQGYERRVQEKDALSTRLASPWDLAFYPDEKHLVIAMAGTHQLWTYDVQKDTVSVLAGNGAESIEDGAYPGNSLSQPSGLAVYGDTLYFVDSETSSLRMLKGNTITTLIGTGLFDFGYQDGKATQALLQHPLGVYADETGVYIADSYNHAIRRFDPKTKTITTVIGKNGLPAKLAEPNDILKMQDRFYITNTNRHEILTWQENEGEVSTLGIHVPKPAMQAIFADYLPNVGKSRHVEVRSGATLTLELQFSSNWGLNEQAPSHLAIYREDKSLVKAWDLEALKTGKLNFTVPEKGPLTVQAIFYHCEKKEGALCLIKSFNDRVYVTPGGNDTKLTFDLRAAE